MRPSRMTSRGHATMTAQPDGSVLVSGDWPNNDVYALEFATERAATKWANWLPSMRAQLLNNPLVAFGGFTGLLSRVTVEREISVVFVRAKATPDETVRLLKMASTLARRGF